MSKNNKTYLLLALVLTIWGILGFKIINGLNPQTEVENTPTIKNDFAVKTILKRDSFEISANYRDPFLGTIPKTERAKRTQPKSVTNPPQPKRNIVYSGFVAQNGNQNRMFFISIEGQQHIMSKNEVVNDVKLVWGDANTIKVKYPGHTETISIE